jgi:hypothetical protein
MTLNITTHCYYAESHFAECHYADCYNRKVAWNISIFITEDTRVTHTNITTIYNNNQNRERIHK